MIETPHPVILEIPETATVPEGWQSAPGSAGEVTLQVQITPKTPGYALRSHDVELARPSKMMGNLSDEPWFEMHGARLRRDVNGRERIYHIQSAVKLHAEGDDCDHISVMIEEEKPDGGSD